MPRTDMSSLTGDGAQADSNLLVTPWKPHGVSRSHSKPCPESSQPELAETVRSWQRQRVLQ